MNPLSMYRKAAHTLVLLGALTFAAAEGAPAVALMALLVVGASLLLTTGKGGKPFPRWTINTALILATLNMVYLATRPGADLISVLSNYIIWLQLIKLFEPATPRDQAQLLSLSAMLVIGACLTNVNFQTGVLVLAYFPVFVLTVLLYQIFAGHQRATNRQKRLVAPAGPALAPVRAASGRRIRFDMSLTAFLIAAATFGLALVPFVLLPRGLSRETISALSTASAQQAMIGFSDRVQLGAQGMLTESRNVVMEMQVRARGVPVPGGTRQYLRGAVLDEYSPRQGLWRRSIDADQANAHTVLYRVGDEVPPWNSEEVPLEQRISLLARPSRHLFAVWKPFELAFEEHTNYTISRVDSTVQIRGRPDVINYWVASDPSADAVLEWSYVQHRAIDREFNPFMSGPIHEYTRELLTVAELERPSDPDLWFTQIDEAVADLIEQHLRQNYLYTTEMVAPDVGQDPIEMFLFETKKGHCEYFASAMAAMCQSIGIEARVVTGYVASEYDTSRKSFIVRQNNAHAWVEAMVAPGVWKRYDPSPQEEVRRSHSPGAGLLARARRVFETLELAWVRSVVTFDQRRQAKFLRAESGGPFGILNRLKQYTTQITGAPTEEAPERIWGLIVSGLVTSVIALGFVVSGIYAAWLLITWFFQRATMSPDARVRRRQIVFYEQMLAALDKLGLSKPQWRPPLAHARFVGVHAGEELGRTVSRLSQLFYACNYGKQQLSESEEHEVQTLLEHLRLAADKTPRRRSG